MANLIEIIITGKNEAKAAMAEAKKDGEGLGSTMTKMGLVAGAALIGIGVESVKMASEYEASTTRLVTSAGESTKNIDMVRKGMLNMAASTATGANELAKGMYTVESAGYHGADGLTVLKAAAQGAKAENAELGTVANAVTDVLTDYHLKASDAADVTSQMMIAVSHGKTSFEDFSGSMHNILPLAAAMHLSFADVSGVLAEMTSHGVSADQASQNMANAMRSLLGPTNAMKTEFKAVGTSADEVHQKLSTVGLSGTLEFLAEKAKAVSPNLLDQEAAMRKLIGTAPGLQVALMTTGENAADTAAAIKDISSATADANGNVKGFSEYQATLKGQVDQLKASFEDLMIKLGDKLIPVIKDVVGWMDKNQGVVLALLGALGGTAAAIATYTLVTKTAAVATKAWALAQAALVTETDLGEASLTRFAAALGPLGLIVGVVTGAAALGEELGKLAGVGDHTSLSIDKMSAALEQSGSAGTNAAQGLGQVAATLMKASQTMNDNKPLQGLQDMDAALANMVGSGHAAQAASAVNDITKSLTAQGVSLGYIHDVVLPKYNAALAAQAVAAKETASSTDDASAAVKALQDANQSGTDTVEQATSAYDAAKKAASGYLDTVDALFGKFGDLSDAQAAFTLALDNGAASITKGKDAVNLSTKAGAQNFQTFEQMAKAAEDVSSKMIEQGKSADDATGSLRGSAKAIDDLAAKSGLTKQQIKDLNTELFGVPDVKNITITADTSPAAMALASLAGQIEVVAGKIGKGGNAAMFRASGGEVGGAATGGDRSGLVWVGEQGPELVRLPAGSTVRSNPDSMAALAAGHGAAGPPTLQVEWVGPPGIDGLMTLVKSWIRFNYGTGGDAVTRALSQNF